MKNLSTIFPVKKPSLHFALGGTYKAGTAEINCNGFFYGEITTIQFRVTKDGKYNDSDFKKNQVVFLTLEGDVEKIVDKRK